MHLWTQILDFVGFLKIDLVRPEVPDSRRPIPYIHRQHKNPVALRTTTLTHNCILMVTSAVKVSSN